MFYFLSCLLVISPVNTDLTTNRCCLCVCVCVGVGARVCACACVYVYVHKQLQDLFLVRYVLKNNLIIGVRN